MPTREAIRSGRRENFYATDNSFMDHYARQMQPIDVAVYHALERYMDWYERSTWVGTAKVAEVLNVHPRTVQRSIKVLENLKLIRIVRTATRRDIYVLPVPPRGKAATTPLFDALDIEDAESLVDSGVGPATPGSHASTAVSQTASAVSRHDDVCDAPYKEEQELLNETQKQDFSKQERLKQDFAKSGPESEIDKAAKSILKGLGLTEASLSAAVAAVESQMKLTTQSMHGTVNDIVTAANDAKRHRGIEREDFLDDFLARKSARTILASLDLPITSNLIYTVAAALKAEVSRTGLSAEKAADFIIAAAMTDEGKGIPIDRFYFENTKWRVSNGGRSKAEQQFDRINRAREKAIENIRARS
jgi:DNA-binding MarR family transcriptional regulator